MFEAINSTVNYVFSLDEVHLARDALWFALSLLDRRVVAVFLVGVATYLWTTMEAMARARSETERQRLEAMYSCEGRVRLQDAVKGVPEMFGTNTIVDVVKHMKSDGRTPLRYSRDVYSGGDGALWRTNCCEVRLKPVDLDKWDRVKPTLRKEIEVAVEMVTRGCRASADINESDTRIFFLFVDLEDSECFVNFFESADMTKRHYVLSLAETHSVKIDFDEMSFYFSTEQGKSTVFTAFESHEYFYAFTVFLAHLHILPTQPQIQTSKFT